MIEYIGIAYSQLIADFYIDNVWVITWQTI